MGSKRTIQTEKFGVFFLRSVRNTVNYFFPEVSYEILGEKSKRLKSMKIQLSVVLITEFFVTNIVKNMHRYLIFAFLEFSVALGVSL